MHIRRIDGRISNSRNSPRKCQELQGANEPTFRSGEMNHIAILLEHIDLLDRLDRLHIQLFEGRLQLLVVCARGLVHLLYFSPRRAFTAVGEMVSNACKAIPPPSSPTRYLATKVVVGN